MFSSLASFIFGSNTSATTNRSEANQNPPRPDEQQQQRQQEHDEHDDVGHNTIQVTSSTPSVAGSTAGCSSACAGRQPQLRRGGKQQSKRNKQKRHAKDTKPSPTLTQLLLTPNEQGVIDEEFDDDDWFIVEKEDDGNESLPRTDSEEELPVQRAARAGNHSRAAAESAAAPPLVAPQHRPNINAHSLYNGPRPHQQRNYLQRARNAPSSSSAASSRGAQLNISALSPPRSVGGAAAAAAAAADADYNGGSGGVTQSLYAVPSGRDGSGGSFGAHPTSMEESWFVTPPPCFTSIGPIHMETSPFENLLIEHPSMSVYHSIRSAQEATESFVNLDLGVEESQQQQQQQQHQQEQQQHGMSAPAAAAGGSGGSVVVTTSNGRNNRAVHARTANVRVDRFAIAQLKQELLAHQAQKSHDKKERKTLCRGAIKRANMARDYQGKGQRPRRADLQHCKVISGANNNRKSHF